MHSLSSPELCMSKPRYDFVLSMRQIACLSNQRSRPGLTRIIHSTLSWMPWLRLNLTRNTKPRLPELLNVASPPVLVSPLHLIFNPAYALVTIMKAESNMFVAMYTV